MITTLKILIKTAEEFDISHRFLDLEKNLVEFKKNGHTVVVYRTVTGLNTRVPCEISGRKALTSQILKRKGLPVQVQTLCRSLSQGKEIGQKMDFPLVVKPNFGSQGKGVTANIISLEELEKAIQKALSFSPRIVVAKHHPGEDYRILILKDRPIAAIKRLPPQVTGNGQASVQELIAEENLKRKKLNQERGVKVLKPINLDEEVNRHLKKNNLQLTSVLPKNKALILRSVANCSIDGLAQTISPSSFHPSIIQAAIEANRLIGLTYAAVDFILKNHQKPFTENNGIILETNSSPGLSPHYYPFEGQPQKIAPLILKALFE